MTKMTGTMITNCNRVQHNKLTEQQSNANRTMLLVIPGIINSGTAYFREINSFGWYNDTVKNSSITTKNLYLILTFRSHHEIFISTLIRIFGCD